MTKLKERFKFPNDTHDIVMIVRTSVELILFIFFVVLASRIPLIQEFTYLKGFQIGLTAALFCSIVFIILVIYRRNQAQSIQFITKAEAITDAILIVWLIFIFDGMGGPFFFFFFLALMETAFTLDVRVISVVTILGVLSLIGDYIFRISQEALFLNAESLIFLFFRLVAVLLISYYSYSFAKSIKREGKKTQEIIKLAFDLEIAKKKVEKAYSVEKQAHEKLKKLDDVKSQFMLATQHHLRTPLTAMQGYLDLLIGGTYGKPPSKIKSTLIKLQNSTKSQVKIVEELLNISQFQLGKKVITLSPNIDINKMLEEIVRQLKPEAERKGIYLKIKKTKDLPEITADPQKLKVALLNIIDNAIKYTEKEGVVISLKEKDSILKIEVIDTGIGISKKDINELFSKIFERGKQAQKIFTTGRGIGLYISGKIIEAHKGRIWVGSEGKEKGSVFHIELPIR